MGNYEVGKVNVVGVVDAADKSYPFGERNSIGERLGEGAVAGEFEDAVLRELEGAEILLVISQPGLAGGYHVVDVIRVFGVVIDLDVDIAVGPGIGVALHFVFSRDVVKEVGNGDVSHTVFVIVAAVFVPFPLRISGR